MMRRMAARVCWYVYGLGVLLCLAQIGIDSARLGGQIFGSIAGMATIAIFIAGAALCAIWDA